jgi:hypothetical protein
MDPIATPSTPEPVNGTVSDWRAPYQADPELGPGLANRSEKDLPTFIKSALSLEKKLGTSLVPPAIDAKPEDIKAFKQKVYTSAPHVFKAPPESPDKYSLTKPESLPDKAWIPKEIEGKYRALAHEYGVPDEFMQKALALRMEEFQGSVKKYEIDNAEAMKSLNAWAEAEKVNPAEVMAKADNFITKVGKDDPQLQSFIEESGLLPIKHPSVMKLLGAAALNAGESSGETGEPGNEVDANAALANSKRIAGDPNHPMYKAFHSPPGSVGQEEAQAAYDAGFQKKYGRQEVT